jgi:hypothetical protein
LKSSEILQNVAACSLGLSEKKCAGASRRRFDKYLTENISLKMNAASRLSTLIRSRAKTIGPCIPGARTHLKRGTELFLLALAWLFATQPSSLPYACGDPRIDPAAGHCYGVTSWTQTTEYFGAFTDITRANINCPSGCGGFVDNEMWLIDNNSPGCLANGFGMCWIEVGIIAEEGRPSTFFWGEARPGMGDTFNIHYFGPSNGNGSIDHYMIVKDGRTSSNPYRIFIFNDSRSTLFSAIASGTGSVGCGSPLGSMVPRTIKIGQELTGSPPQDRNASADRAEFTDNVWAIRPLDSEYIFVYDVQNRANTPRSDGPPTARWSLAPGAPGAPQGGKFTTECCR